MKRVWIAAIILAIAVGLCCWEQIYIKDFYCDINSMVEDALENNDKEAAEKIKAYWERKNDIMYFFSQHDLLNDIATSIEAVDQNEDNTDALYNLKIHNRIYYENQKLTLSNIF